MTETKVPKNKSSQSTVRHLLLAPGVGIASRSSVQKTAARLIRETIFIGVIEVVAASHQELDCDHDDIQQPRRYTAPKRQVHRNYETVPVSWVNQIPKTQRISVVGRPKTQNRL